MNKKKALLYKCSLFVMLLFHGMTVFSQQHSLDEVKAQLDTMFSGLDKTKVPTGFLWDNAVNLVERESYNGSSLTDSNYVSFSIMRDLLKSINSASVGADTICVQDALSRIRRNSSLHNVMIGVLFQPINYIVANALTDNLICYSNGIVSDVHENGIWKNPYGEDALFGYVIGDDGVAGEEIVLTFTNIDTLSTNVFSSIQFDPGDGRGYQPVENGSFAVTYLTSGCFKTRLKVSVGGHTYEGHSVFYVLYPEIEPNSTNSYVDSVVFSSNNYNGQACHARLVFKETVTFNKRPLIVSEGFDPWRLCKGSIHPYSGFTDVGDIVDISCFEHFDVFYVDWFDYGADIRANAEVLKKVIKWVNAHNQSGEPNIVMGQSMGGLIARYALRRMESG